VEYSSERAIASASPSSKVSARVAIKLLSIQCAILSQPSREASSMDYLAMGSVSCSSSL
jgi:hypothetical protein